MIDKVIQGLECCFEINHKDCTVCPYDLQEPLCTHRCMEEALEVLKDVKFPPSPNKDAGGDSHG
jgi:hypothetical protein